MLAISLRAHIGTGRSPVRQRLIRRGVARASSNNAAYARAVLFGKQCSNRYQYVRKYRGRPRVFEGNLTHRRLAAHLIRA